MMLENKIALGINEGRQERRKHKRHIFNYKIELFTADGKKSIRCASYDLSEGGIRVVTNMELRDRDYIVIIDGNKLSAKLVYQETRHSTMMNQQAYYHGLQFVKPLSPAEKNKLINVSKKSGF